MGLEASFVSGNINLEGTLALPDVNAKGLPTFVFIHGSRPTDRDENPDLALLSPESKEKLVETLKAFNLDISQYKLNVFNEMSSYFVKKGFATFRYDTSILYADS